MACSPRYLPPQKRQKKCAADSYWNLRQVKHSRVYTTTRPIVVFEAASTDMCSSTRSRQNTGTKRDFTVYSGVPSCCVFLLFLVVSGVRVRCVGCGRFYRTISACIDTRGLCSGRRRSGCWWWWWWWLVVVVISDVLSAEPNATIYYYCTYVLHVHHTPRGGSNRLPQRSSSKPEQKSMKQPERSVVVLVSEVRTHNNNIVGPPRGIINIASLSLTLLHVLNCNRIAGLFLFRFF